LRLGEGEELVIQCKHRPNATIAQLRSDLRDEARKPIVDAAARYLLVTSARLTRANKDEIVEIFGKRILLRDVLGRNDIEDLLRRYPDVERANSKLWMTSSRVLQTLLHQVEHLRSASLIEELIRLRSTYVETPVLQAARNWLDRQGVCILTGPPGVGKTTTAHILLLQLMASGWRPITAVGQLHELEVQFQPNVKQVLLFDDFLGQTSLQAKLQRGEDSELLRLIRAVRSDKSKCLILTTRDYILKQAQQSYEQLGDPMLNASRVSMKLDALDLNARAHILYNQLYYSPLRALAAAASDKRRRYMQLTRHRNYNPRLIQEAIASAARDIHLDPLKGNDGRLGLSIGSADRTEVFRRPHTADSDIEQTIKSLDIPEYLYAALENPSRLWDHVLRYQLTAAQRALLVVRASFGRFPTFLADVYAATAEFVKMNGYTMSAAELDAALSVLDGDLLSVADRDTAREDTLVDGLHPGVAEAVEVFMRGYPDTLHQLVTTATSFEQVHWLGALVGADEREPLTALARNQSAQTIIDELTVSAERTLESRHASPENDLFTAALMPIVARRRHFSDIGLRLNFLFRLYSIANRGPLPTLPRKIAPALVAGIKKMARGEVLRLLSALRGEIPALWRPWRTDVEVAVLRTWGNPDDMDDWRFLQEVLDIVPTVPEYKSDLRQKFAEFAAEQLEQIEADLEDRDNDGSDESDLLTELFSLGDYWGVSVDIGELAERAEENRVRVENQLNAQNGPIADPRQLPLFNLFERQQERIHGGNVTVQNGAIFDRL
jgi:DNA polymerase III delta prime subunit